MNFRNVGEVIAALTARESQFRAARDRRAVFCTTYLTLTNTLSARLHSGAFHDPVWVDRLTATFAAFYVNALDGPAPKCWRITFEAGAGGRSLVIQDLLLGMNAHINHDLALALSRVGIDPDRESRHHDHHAVNAVLAEAADAIQSRIAAWYAPGLATLDVAAGRLDEITTLFSTTLAREHAWASAVALTASRHDWERALIERAMDASASVLARVILSPNVSPMLLDALRRFEETKDWCALLTEPRA